MTDELYPGHARDMRRDAAVEQAVSEVTRILLDASDGSTEETDALTNRVALKLMEQTQSRLDSRLSAYDLETRAESERAQEILKEEQERAART